MADEARIQAALEAYVEAWHDNDREGLLALWADDCHWEDPVGSDPMKGKAAVAEFWDKTRSTPMTLTPAVDRIIVVGNEAILNFVMQVRGPDGGGMDLFVAEHFVFDDDAKIVSARAFWNESCQTPVAPS